MHRAEAPEFLTPSVFEELRKKFDLRPISTPEEDLPEMLGKGSTLSSDSPLAS